MFKNAVIAILISALWHTTMCGFDFFTFICFASVLFFVVWQVEEWINDFKRKLVFKRRIQKKIAQIKISPKPTKAS